MVRGLKRVLALTGLGLVGAGLRWVTAGSVANVSLHDLPAMASLTVAAVAWVAYAWLLVAVVATVLEQLPGVLGRAAAVVASGVTSQGSRALLRSALGVAAVTPLTIGVAHASPGDGARTWTDVEPASSVKVGDTPADWRSVEKPSSVELGEPLPGPRSHPTVSPRPTPEQAPNPTRAERPDIPDRPVRTNRAATPGHPVQPNQPAGAQRPTQAERPASRPAQPDQRAQTARPASPERPAAELSRSGEPTAVPQRPGQPAAEPSRPGEPTGVPRTGVRVPDRPTDGAPTRYTDLRSGRHVVLAGESLWSIAAAELGPGATDAQIAARWPRWYEANRSVIGSVPGLIHPGQVLLTPAADAPATHEEN